MALVRAIRRWDLVGLSINSIIGAGIFGLPSEVFRRVGVYSLVTFVVCGIAVTLFVLCFAEVSSRYSGTGGSYLYAREAFGPVPGFVVGWLVWIARVTAFAANCNLFVSYFTFFVPGAGQGAGRAITICLIVFVITLINVRGVRGAAVASNAFTVAKLTPLLLFIVVGSFAIDTKAFAAGPLPDADTFSVSVLLLIYAFSGFEMSAIASGEAKDPRRDLPRALLIATAVVVSVYIAIQVVAIGTFPGLATATRPLADAGARFLGTGGAAIITAGALISILGNLNATMLVAPRLPYAMAERHELPAFLAITHKTYRTPHVAILLTAAIVLVLTLTGTFVYALTISVIARLLSYAATSAALPVLRRRKNAPEALFHAPAGVAVAVVSLVIVGWLLSNSTLAQARDSGIAIAIGLALHFLVRKRKQTEAAV